MIPVYQPALSGNEEAYVLDCLKTNWISSKGRYVETFESEFSNFCGLGYSATVSNGTVALHTALLALGIGVGDEVLVPTLTYVAAVNAITYTGATPVFLDSDPSTWQLDCSTIASKVTDATKAVLAVHLYGLPCDMASLTNLCKEHGLLLIEDCAEAFGTYFEGRHVGTFGDVATFSFYGNKTITTGEGGMVCSNSPELHADILRLKGQGLAPGRQYWHDIVGYNYRMTNICAAIGLAQLENANRVLEAKRDLISRYRQRCDGIPVVFHAEAPKCTHSYWMICVLLPDHVDRDTAMSYLAQQGIETRPIFYPIHLMPMYEGKAGDYPIAESIAKRGINLPSWPDLTDNQLDEVAQGLAAVCSQ